MADPPAPGMTDKQSRDYATVLHLSALSGLVIPLGDLLGPLIMWIIKKDQSPFIDRHGKAAVNFHLSVLLYALIFVVFIVMITIMTLGIGLLLMIPLIILGAIAAAILLIVLPIIACLKAQNGEEYSYPLTIRFLK